MEKCIFVCALLRNALTCLYGNTTSDFFQLDPPSLEDYFAQLLFILILVPDTVKFVLKEVCMINDASDTLLFCTPLFMCTFRVGAVNM